MTFPSFNNLSIRQTGSAAVRLFDGPIRTVMAWPTSSKFEHVIAAHVGGHAIKIEVTAGVVAHGLSAFAMQTTPARLVFAAEPFQTIKKIGNLLIGSHV